MKERQVGKMPLTFGTIWNLIYPIILAVATYGILVKIIGFKFTTDGYEDVLSSIINFSSIIIGFYTAMYGVMISLLDSDIFYIFRKNKVEGYLKFQLYDSLVSSFIILLLSIIMQVMIKQKYSDGNLYIIKVAFDLWNLVLGYFVGTSFRSISLLLKMMFTNKKENKESLKNEARKKEQIENLKRNNPK